MPHLGKFRVVGHGRRAWTCDSCLDKPTFIRCGRRRETPPEKTAREILLQSGHKFYQEYELKKFKFDFAIPRLRLLIEIDSRSYHRYPRQKANDRAKTKVAEEQKWSLLRVQWPGDLEGIIAKTICDLEAQLGLG
jgi:very-short-patch-repair endonuclease